jgi:hypothetical protein
MTISIQGAPTANAGTDATICSTDTYTLSGSATNQASVQWTSGGDGSFDDATLLNATYTPGPGDLSSGSVTLTLTAFAIAPCGSDATDDMTISIQGAPTANAGTDATICESGDYTLSGSATNQTSVLWSSSGDGTFDDATLLNATYTPGSGDIGSGSVTLTLTAFATAPCSADATDDMTLSITGAPTANAGTDAAICSTDTYTLSGSATNQTSVFWTTAGDGTFDDATLLNATYTPGSGDITTGSAVLTLTAFAAPPCSDATDDITISIQAAATANAGLDASICETGDYTLSGTATNQTSVLWTTGGDGSFDDPTSLTATYTPGSGDISAGTVDLTLTAFAVAPCSDATDDITISILGAPTANAGADANICSTDSYLLSGSATNQTSVQWTTGGDGTFDDATLLDATYTPGSGDISAGTVDLTLTAFAASPCTDATDIMTISIQGAPTADAGSDATICEDGDHTLSGSAANNGSVLWTSSGDGTFDDASLLNATYTPGSGDITAGSATLTLTAAAIAPCSSDASDDMVLSIQGLPSANAGSDDAICEGSDYTLSGSADNQFSTNWTTSGDGTFDDPVLLAATYTPGTGDIAAGTVTLTLTATSVPPCSSSAADAMVLTIQGAPTANAGPDDVVDSGSDYTLAAATASNQSSLAWSTSGDGSFDNTALLNATYTPGTADLDLGYVTLTLTANATAPCTGTAVDDMTLRFSYTQPTNLSLGWNIMSFYVVPADLDMLNIVQPLIDAGELIKVMDEDGNFVEFIPGPGWTNTIGNMANTEGYYIKVNANTNLDADGTYVIFPFDVDLFTGWNISGYPVKVTQDAITLLQPLIDNGTLIKVMNEAGDFIQFIPPYGWLNTIINFVPGEGYYIKTSADEVLTYNQPTKKSAPGIKPEIPATKHFFASGSNPFNPMNIVIQEIKCDGFTPEDGDEIAIYDGEIEVGSAVIHQHYNGYQVINAAGDDPSTEAIEGFTQGNAITFKYWDQSTDMVYENVRSTNTFGEETFTGLGTYAGILEISALGVSEYDQNAYAFLGQNYPNPFSNNTTINYGIYEDGNVLLSIFDVWGRRIQVLEDAQRTRGQYSITYNNASLEPGVYYYQLEFSSNGKTVFSATRKMIVQ